MDLGIMSRGMHHYLVGRELVTTVPSRCQLRSIVMFWEESSGYVSITTRCVSQLPDYQYIDLTLSSLKKAGDAGIRFAD
jgi:hypothetical protein